MIGPSKIFDISTGRDFLSWWVRKKGEIKEMGLEERGKATKRWNRKKRERKRQQWLHDYLTLMIFLTSFLTTGISGSSVPSIPRVGVLAERGETDSMDELEKKVERVGGFF